MWRSAALVSQFLRAAFDIHTRVLPQSDPYMFLCWHNIKSKVSLATVQDSKIWTVALSAIEVSPFRYKGAVLPRFPCGLMVLTSPAKAFIVIVLDVWIRQIDGGGGAAWDWGCHIKASIRL